MNMYSKINILISQNNCHEVQELINIYQEKDKQRMVLECRKFPLIILEGLDGCGNKLC